MVKCSFIVGFTVYALMGSTVLAAAVGDGSGAKDTNTTVANDTSTISPTDVGNDPHDSIAPGTNNNTVTLPAVNGTATSITATTTEAPTVKPGPTPISGQTVLVPAYAECGGFGFDYSVYMPENPSTSMFTMLTCEQGYRCQGVDGQDTYLCKEWPSRDPVAFYGQCGGGNYDGQTFCAPGAVCKYISASFSQCLPTY